MKKDTINKKDMINFIKNRLLICKNTINGSKKRNFLGFKRNNWSYVEGHIKGKIAELTNLLLWVQDTNFDYYAKQHTEQNTISGARKTFQQAFKKDPYFKNTYVANIALRVLHDKYNVPVKLATKQVTDILNLIFGDKKCTNTD